MLRKLLPLALLVLACHRAEVPSRPPVILISIDTLRSDHLPAALDDAEAHAKLALARNPAAAHEMLARVAAAHGDFAAAKREAELAQILLAQNDPQSALAALQRIYTASRVKKAQLPSGYFAVTGEVFLKLGRREEARLAFLQAVQLHPDDRASRKRRQALD